MWLDCDLFIHIFTNLQELHCRKKQKFHPIFASFLKVDRIGLEASFTDH